MSESMKLNIGAGNKNIPGWLSVDADPATKPDILGTALSIPLPDESASTVMAIHLLEHLHQWEAEPALREWFRLLAPGGLLILEMPDFLKFCKNIADGVVGRKHPDQMGMWPAYGDPRDKNPLMCHKWAYWFDSLKPLVESIGFRSVKELPTQFHAIGRDHRDFRLEARKP